MKAFTRELIRHDDDCPGGEGCDCDDDSDCDEDENLECDEGDGECVEREDGADSLRVYMHERYGADLRAVPGAQVARRAATILGVDVAGMTDAAMVALVTLRADEEWRIDADREYERDEGGKFAATGSGVSAGEKGERVSNARESRNAAFDHREASRVHSAEGERIANTHGGSADQQDRHFAASKAHYDAAVAHEKAARGGGIFDAREKSTAAKEASARTGDERKMTLADLDAHRERVKEAMAQQRDAPHTKATESAYAKGREAQASGTSTDHRAAAYAHEQALTLNRAAGEGGMVKLHHEQMEAHTQLAAKAGLAERAKAEADYKAHQAAFSKLSPQEQASKVQEAKDARAATKRAIRDMPRTPEEQAFGNRVAEAKQRLNDAARRSPEGAHAAPQSGAAQHDHGQAHADRAAGHAERAKAAASGTSPAARASARKAAESAALAKVAASHGDHADAAKHAANAERHANAAAEKAAAHRGESSKSERVTTANMGASNANAVKASDAAEGATKRARSSGSPTDHMAAAAMHDAAASAMSRIGSHGAAAMHESMAEGHREYLASSGTEAKTSSRFPAGAKVTTASGGQMFTGGSSGSNHYGQVVGHDKDTGHPRVKFESGREATVHPRELSRVAPEKTLAQRATARSRRGGGV